MDFPFPRGKFSIIYVDPPWSYTNKGSRACADNHYPTMAMADLMVLPVESIAADDCVLFMWHVPAMPREALALVDAWGFTFKTMKGFTWVKETKHGKEHIGMGNYTRGNTEDCLVAIRGKGLQRLDKGVRQLIEEDEFDLNEVIRAKVWRHSQKPDEVRHRIERLYGDVPRIELFARQVPPGWQCWGNEVTSADIEDLI